MNQPSCITPRPRHPRHVGLDIGDTGPQTSDALSRAAKTMTWKHGTLAVDLFVRMRIVSLAS